MIDNGLNEFRESVLSQLKANGFDLPQIELKVVQFIDEQHKDCLWYGGQVASVRYKGLLFSLEARGDVDATLLDDKNHELCWSRDKTNSGGFRADMDRYLADDKSLADAKESGRLVLKDNNWFEIFIQMPDAQWQNTTYVCNDDDLRECIIEMVENMDLMIEELDLEIEVDKIKGVYEKLYKRVDAEREAFRSEYQNKQPMEVYSDWYRISFHEAYFDMLSSGWLSDQAFDDEAVWLAEELAPVGMLYSEYLRRDGEMSFDWDNMIDLVRNVYAYRVLAQVALDDQINQAVGEVGENRSAGKTNETLGMERF